MGMGMGHTPYGPCNQLWRISMMGLLRFRPISPNRAGDHFVTKHKPAAGGVRMPVTSQGKGSQGVSRGILILLTSIIIGMVAQ